MVESKGWMHGMGRAGNAIGATQRNAMAMQCTRCKGGVRADRPRAEAQIKGSPPGLYFELVYWLGCKGRTECMGFGWVCRSMPHPCSTPLTYIKGGALKRIRAGGRRDGGCVGLKLNTLPSGCSPYPSCSRSRRPCTARRKHVASCTVGMIA